LWERWRLGFIEEQGKMVVTYSANGIGENQNAQPNQNAQARSTQFPLRSWNEGTNHRSNRDASIGLIVAQIDGQVWCGWPPVCQRVGEGIDPSEIAGRMPLRIRGTGLQRITVLRDIHYRAWKDAEEGELASGQEGYLLLGDNVPLSEDGRIRWAQGVPRSWVRGVVLEPLQTVPFK
jgi:hypothetical protein